MKNFERRGQTQTDGGFFHKVLITLLTLGMGVLLIGSVVSPGKAEILYVKKGARSWTDPSGSYPRDRNDRIFIEDTDTSTPVPLATSVPPTPVPPTPVPPTPVPPTPVPPTPVPPTPVPPTPVPPTPVPPTPVPPTPVPPTPVPPTPVPPTPVPPTPVPPTPVSPTPVPPTPVPPTRVPSVPPTSTPVPTPQGPVIYKPLPKPGEILTPLTPGKTEKELVKQLGDPQSPEHKELFEKLRKFLTSKGLTLDPENFHLATERLYSLEGAENPLKVILQISSPNPEEGEGYLLFVLIRTYDTESSPRKFLGYEPILLSPLSDATSPVAASEEARLYGYNVYDGTSLDELPQEGHIQVTYLEAWGKGGISEIAPSPDPSGDDGGCSLELPSLGGILLMLPPLLLLRGKRK